MAKVAPGGDWNSLPPAMSSAASSCPCFIGVWQWWQADVRSTYSPCFSGVVRSGAGTGPTSGWGTPRMTRPSGKGGAVFGSGLRIGFRVRRYTTIAARSSSGIRRNSSNGMRANRAWPSAPTPSRIARAIASSLNRPIPVSGSGVRLGAVTQGIPSAVHTTPPPNRSTRGGAPGASQSRSLWQKTHPWRASAR